jgi:hypothetical protein
MGGARLFSQTRQKVSPNVNRFEDLVNIKLTGEPDTEPYGTNPFMYSVSPLFDAEILASADDFYTPEEVHNVTSPVTGDIQTKRPAFEAYPMAGFDLGFPVSDGALNFPLNRFLFGLPPYVAVFTWLCECVNGRLSWRLLVSNPETHSTLNTQP